MKKDITIDDVVYYLIKRASCLTHESLIEALDYLDSYTVYKKPKRSGGFREISAPHDALKKLQRGLLDNFFDRIRKRAKYYSNPHNKIPTKDLVVYQASLGHKINKKIHGSVKETSIRTAGKEHLNHKSQGLFATHFDFKDAFPSVNMVALAIVLYKIIEDDVLAYYCAFRKKRQAQKTMETMNGFFDKRKSHFVKKLFDRLSDEGHDDIFERTVQMAYDCTFTDLTIRDFYPPLEVPKNETDRYSKKFSGNKRRTSLVNHYPKFPLFPSNNFYEFRSLIRSVVDSEVGFRDSILPEIINIFVKKILEIVTYKGVLPQGAPTSGFLLALTVSEFKIIEKIQKCFDPEEIVSLSLYVDDLVIVTNKKPDEAWKKKVADVIESSTIFKINKDKTYTIDLRNKAMPFLGGKLALHPKFEFESICSKYAPTVYKRIITLGKNGKTEKKIAFGLSKKTQKKYRAILHQACTKENLSFYELERAKGYYGHILATYRNTGIQPSSLDKVIDAFHRKYGTRNWNKERTQIEEHRAKALLEKSIRARN